VQERNGIKPPNKRGPGRERKKSGKKVEGEESTLLGGGVALKEISLQVVSWGGTLSRDKRKEGKGKRRTGNARKDQSKCYPKERRGRKPDMDRNVFYMVKREEDRLLVNKTRRIPF